MNWFPSLPKFPSVFGKKTSADIQTEIDALDKKCAADKTALETKLREAQAAESPSSGTAQLGGRRRKHKGTRRHKKGKSKRARTGRKSSRL